MTANPFGRNKRQAWRNRLVLYDLTTRTLQDTGLRYGLTPTRVRQIAVEEIRDYFPELKDGDSPPSIRQFHQRPRLNRRTITKTTPWWVFLMGPCVRMRGRFRHFRRQS